ncbi:pyridoxamine 5'-phosphate oxidase family protein [Oceaniserpentilla sp. 4NH20-0058]|uniref:MSMEG_1061 family FMN-dependent PPOX-type flavoprotein n=1 Tax=Oceaniserpentilla sp. 4NH20-0058 TaxID=3127660 RepID=UPI00310A036E
MYPFKQVLQNQQELTNLLGEPHPVARDKAIDCLDDFCKTFISRSPFVVVATCDELGNLDTSPKGDPAGFVKILDDHTIVMPERPGNKRADSYNNILRNPKAALIFFIPGKKETFRVSGSARIIRDANILDDMQVNGKSPLLGLAIHVEEAFFHCAKSTVRSKLWQPEHWPNLAGLPTLAETMIKKAPKSISLDDLEKGVHYDVENKLY